MGGGGEEGDGDSAGIGADDGWEGKGVGEAGEDYGGGGGDELIPFVANLAFFYLFTILREVDDTMW